MNNRRVKDFLWRVHFFLQKVVVLNTQAKSAKLTTLTVRKCPPKFDFLLRLRGLLTTYTYKLRPSAPLSLRLRYE